MGSCSVNRDETEKITPLYTCGKQISLNGIWKFRYFPSLLVGTDSLFYLEDYDDSGWSSIKVPGHWELQGFAPPTYERIDEGTGLYRTSFTVPQTLQGGQVFIRFEGVLYSYEVYVNGKHVGDWASSSNEVSFNITDVVSYTGENTLAVRVSTRGEGYRYDINDDWALSGIYRDVVIFGTPNMYIDDYTVQTYLNPDSSARIKVDVKVQNSGKGSGDRCQLKTVLYSPEGDGMGEQSSNGDVGQIIQEIRIPHPELWTAESPVLYKLHLSLLQDNQVIQEVIQSVGIREITIEDAVLKLNGHPIKLHGIDHHDLVPETGKVLSWEDELKDLKLIKEANINFIRTSHGPPEREMLDLCDSMGLYVVCEVPFSVGSGLLKEKGYKNLLIDRASATLLRDKNHPSVILWSIGNENPLTPITVEAGKFVKQTDPTRPICYPMGSHDFDTYYEKIPDFVDIYAPHYKSAGWVKKFALTSKKPVVMTEYAHAMGLSFGNLEDIWKEMVRHDGIAGGAVWLFQDQGILQKSDTVVDRTKPTIYAWTDSVHYYNTTFGGVDGIVYSDRTPQVDYWQLKKVYSPVQIIESEMPVHSGNQQLKITVYNQYDFTNLSSLLGKWSLYRNRNRVSEGQIALDCNPHDTAVFTLPVVLLEHPEEDVWLLKFSFKDRSGISVYDHTINLMSAGSFSEIKDKICNEANKNILKVSNSSPDNTKIETHNFIYEINKDKLAINLVSKGTNTKLITDGIFARTGRTYKVTDYTIKDKLEDNQYYWNPFLLRPVRVNNIIEKTEGDKYQFSATGTFPRGETFPNQKIEGEIQYSIKDGCLTVSYDLKPVNATGIFQEAGVSFMLSSGIKNFQWLGDGPYASYPDKHQLNEFGIYCMKTGDINFNGNRGKVEIAILTDDKGDGIAILGTKSDISVELKDHRIVVGHNVLLTGLGNKKTIPTPPVWVAEVKEIKGEFKIIPLKAGVWPEKLKDILGYPDKSIHPFNPFYYSYDTSE